MRKLLAILAVALAIPTMSFALGEGRYQIASLNIADQPHITGVWVIDTKTGLLRFCVNNRMGDLVLRCTETIDASKKGVTVLK